MLHENKTLPKVKVWLDLQSSTCSACCPLVCDTLQTSGWVELSSARFNVPPNTLQVISGMDFMGQKTQLTLSKHWRMRSPKDQASIPLGSPHCADNNTTCMQYEKNTKYTQINTTKSRLCTVKCTQCDKTQSSPSVWQKPTSHVHISDLLNGLFPGQSWWTSTWKVAPVWT